MSRWRSGNGHGRTGFLEQENPCVQLNPNEIWSTGMIMAEMDGQRDMWMYRKDARIQGKLTTVKRIFYEGQDVYLLGFTLHLMHSFSPQYCFSGANVEITINMEHHTGVSTHSDLFIQAIFPDVLAIQISDREIHSNDEFGLTGGIAAGLAQINLNTK